jgi:hypothetical protein
MTLEAKNPARDFIFYPLLDLYGHDVEFMKDIRIESLTNRANQSDKIVCFNTGGCMKQTWNPITATKLYGSWKEGTYVKRPKGEARISKIVHQIGNGSSSVQKVVEQESGWVYMAHKNGNKYDILKEYGGIFIDKACDLLKPLKESLLCHDIFVAFENEKHFPGVISTNVIGAVAGCKALDTLKELDEQNNISIGDLNIFIYPSYYFYPVSRVGDMCSDELITMSYTNYIAEKADEIKGNKGDSKGVDQVREVKRSQPSAAPPVTVKAISTSAHETAILVQELTKLLEEKKITSMADLSYGEYSWMKEVKRSDKLRYVGLSSDQNIINKNLTQHPKLEFKLLNMTCQVPPNVDLIVCRDSFAFMRYEDCKKAINNFRNSGSKYLLITSFIGRRSNSDTISGQWRTLNLQVAPFSFPMPLQVIAEQCTEGVGLYVDKTMCLWHLQQISPM